MGARTLVRWTLLLAGLGGGFGCGSAAFGAKVNSPDGQGSVEGKAADLVQDVLANLEVLATQPAQKPAAAAALEHVLRDLRTLIGQAADKTVAAAAEFPRELGMKPLPAYRIAPPDLIQIELIESKAAPGGGGQSPPAPQQGAAPAGPESAAGQAAISGSFDLQVDKPATLTKSGSGTLILSGKSDNGVVVSAQTSSRPAGAKLAAAGGRQPAPNITARYVGTRMEASGGGSISDVYLVGPDGTINLRRYGTVEVMGMTIAEAKQAVEKHLAGRNVPLAEVAIDVAGYNSKVYYIITEGAGQGDNVVRVPVTGNETVLDAISQIGGLSQLASKKIWIARPSASAADKGTILAVDWDGITRRGAVATNYQVMPGDRIFIAEDSLVALNIWLGKLSNPVERILGMLGLGTSTIRNMQRLARPQDEDK